MKIRNTSWRKLGWRCSIIVVALLFFYPTAHALQPCFSEIMNNKHHFSKCLYLAEKGDADAQFMVAQMLQDGLGVKQNNIDAYKFYMISENSRKWEKDAIHQIKQLSKIMSQNQVQQAKILAYEYLVQSGLSFGIPSNHSFSFWVVANIYQKKGKQFNAITGYLLSGGKGNNNGARLAIRIFQKGEDFFAFNKKRNLEWYKESAEEGDKEATLILAYMYLHGKHTPQNKQKALHWYKQAAKLKQNEEHNGFNIMAMYLVAWMYDTAQGVPQDYQQAFDWYQKAAEAGYGDAQLRLADLYQQGQGTEKDKQQAIKWIKTAAEQGYNKAQRILADHYRNGTLLEQDSKHAFDWYKKAAVLEDTQAQYALAQLYATGEGTVKNTLNSYILSAYLANNYDHTDAKTLCQQLEKQMTSDQLQQAKKLAVQWQADAKYRTLGVAVPPPFDW